MVHTTKLCLRVEESLLGCDILIIFGICPPAPVRVDHGQCFRIGIADGSDNLVDQNYSGLKILRSRSIAEV